MQYEEKYIYPFLVDFIIMRFHLMILVSTLQNKLANGNSNDNSKGSNQSYRMMELRILEIFAEHFDNANHKKTQYDPIETNVTIFLMYHYGQILNAKYSSMDSMIKQLIYDDVKKPIELDNGQKISPKQRYALKPKHKKRLEQIPIIHDDFRDLSLYVL